MKILGRVVFLISLLVCVAVSPISAQEKQAQSADSLREKISQLEGVNLSTKSPSVQDIYKRSLLRLYNQYSLALQQDITDLKKILSATSDPGAGQPNEVADKIKLLEKELSITNEKIQTLGGDMQTNTASSGSSSPPAPPSTISENPPLISASLTRPRTSETESSAASAMGTRVATAETIPSTDSVPSAPAKTQATGEGDKDKKEEPSNPVKVCGQIRPASLTRTFALIASAADQLPKTRRLIETRAVQNSRLTDTCEDNNVNVENFKTSTDRAAFFTTTAASTDTSSGIPTYNGSQKDAVVFTLQTLLQELHDNPEILRKAGPQFKSFSQDTIKKQILLLNEYIGNVRVIIKEGDKIVATPMTDKDGNYKVQLQTGKNYYFSTEADDSHFVREEVFNEAPTGTTGYRVNLFIEDRPVSLLARAVVGYEQAGAASTKKNQDYFFDLFISKTFPVNQKIDPNFGEPFRTWLDFRFASVPQTGDVELGTFSTGFVSQVSGLKVKDVANVFEFLGGIEYRLLGNSALLPSFDRRTKQKFTLSLIAGGGFTTPTNPLDSISTFKVFPDAPGLPPEAAGKEFVAFVPLDRDRFFRQYYVGLRLQTFFFNKFNIPSQRFPGQMDLTIGQNEFITGGKLRGPVIRIEGYYPLPYEEVKFINIFGTALLRPGRARTAIPLVLEPAPAGTVVPASNVALIGVPQQTRDYYRVGVGLDFISFVQKLKETMSKK